MVMSTIIAGAKNGLLVFAGLVVVLLAGIVKEEGISAARTLPVVLLGSVVGGTLAFMSGGIAGLMYGLAETLLFRVSRALHKWATAHP
jgi:hypothetical protein